MVTQTPGGPAAQFYVTEEIQETIALNVDYTDSRLVTSFCLTGKNLKLLLKGYHLQTNHTYTFFKYNEWYLIKGNQIQKGRHHAQNITDKQTEQIYQRPYPDEGKRPTSGGSTRVPIKMNPKNPTISHIVFQSQQ